MMELIAWLVAIYAVICLAAHFGNRLFMYSPDPTRVAPAKAGLNGIEEVELAVANDITLRACEEDNPTILYFHGNGANAANRGAGISSWTRACQAVEVMGFASRNPS